MFSLALIILYNHCLRLILTPSPDYQQFEDRSGLHCCILCVKYRTWYILGQQVPVRWMNEGRGDKVKTLAGNRPRNKTHRENESPEGMKKQWWLSNCNSHSTEVDRKAKQKPRKRQDHREDLQRDAFPIREHGIRLLLLSSEILSSVFSFVQPCEWTYCLHGNQSGAHHTLSVQAFSASWRQTRCLEPKI